MKHKRRRFINFRYTDPQITILPTYHDYRRLVLDIMQSIRNLRTFRRDVLPLFLLKRRSYPRIEHFEVTSRNVKNSDDLIKERMYIQFASKSRASIPSQ